MKYLLTFLLCCGTIAAAETKKPDAPAAPAKKDQTKVSEETKRLLPTDDEMKAVEKFAIAFKHGSEPGDELKTKCVEAVLRLSDNLEDCTDADWAARANAELQVSTAWQKYNQKHYLQQYYKTTVVMFGGGTLVNGWPRFAASAFTKEMFYKRVTDFYALIRTKGQMFITNYALHAEDNFVQKAVWQFIEKNPNVFQKPQDKVAFINSMRSYGLPSATIADMLKEVQP